MPTRPKGHCITPHAARTHVVLLFLICVYLCPIFLSFSDVFPCFFSHVSSVTSLLFIDTTNISFCFVFWPYRSYSLPPCLCEVTQWTGRSHVDNQGQPSLPPPTIRHHPTRAAPPRRRATATHCRQLLFAKVNHHGVAAHGMAVHRLTDEFRGWGPKQFLTNGRSVMVDCCQFFKRCSTAILKCGLTWECL